MPRAKPQLTFTFDDACSLLKATLNGSTRQEIVADVLKAADLGKALLRLRDVIRADAVKWEACEHHARREGFHVLHDWDGKADRVNAETIPVDVLNYVIERRGAEQPGRIVPAILLDYYLLYVLALLSLRVWDEGNPDDNLDRLNQLLQDLQGPDGSGQQFAADVETLILIATSHYELNEGGYEKLLERVRALNPSHRKSLALGHAASLGSHLRFGFEATYGRDMDAMRDDNIVDYPWLCFSLATLMREYARLRDVGVQATQGAQGTEVQAIAEAILNGLSPDTGAFTEDSLASLAAHQADLLEFRELFHEYRQDLLGECERYRPSDHVYSPISLFFNFSYNVLKGTVVDALLWGEPWSLTLNDLFTGISPGNAKGESKKRLATALMGYARANPDRIRGRLMPVIVYDPQRGHQAFATTVRKIKDCA